MEIQYLTYLRDNPFGNPGSLSDKDPIEPMSLEEIEILEALYNNGNPFPKALKELLFLAGNSCYVLDKGIYPTQEKMQQFVRNRLIRAGKTISRPFYTIDIYNGPEQCIFVYLDESENPQTYGAYYFADDSSPNSSPKFIEKIELSLTELINHRIDRNKVGRNPF